MVLGYISMHCCYDGLADTVPLLTIGWIILADLTLKHEMQRVKRPKIGLQHLAINHGHCWKVTYFLSMFLCVLYFSWNESFLFWLMISHLTMFWLMKTLENTHQKEDVPLFSHPVKPPIFMGISPQLMTPSRPKFAPQKVCRPTRTHWDFATTPHTDVSWSQVMAQTRGVKPLVKPPSANGRLVRYYSLVMTNIAIENGHWNSEFSRKNGDFP